MNKFNLRDFLRQALAPHAACFKSTSYDKENNEHLCQDVTTPDVYDFDAYIAATHPADKLPASPDAIYIGHKQLYFIEFKNQAPTQISRDKIQNKFRKGTDILKAMLAEFTPRDCKYNFCVVYKATSKPRYFDRRHFEQTAARFELETINKECGNFYDQIHTEDVDFFIREFKQLRC